MEDRYVITVEGNGYCVITRWRTPKGQRAYRAVLWSGWVPGNQPTEQQALDALHALCWGPWPPAD